MSPVRPRVWVSVEYAPPNRFYSCFDSAYEARQALREQGIAANLFSTRQPLDQLPVQAGDVLYPIAETCQELPGDPVGLRRLAQHRRLPVIGSPWQVVRAASDKATARETIRQAGVAVPHATTLSGAGELEELVAATRTVTGLPAVAKPVSGRGGSIGVEYLPDEHALRWRIRRFLLAPKDPLLIEEYVRGVELTAWVLQLPGRPPEVEVLEIAKNTPIFDRHAKNGRQRAGLHLVEDAAEEDPDFAVHRPPRITPVELSAVRDTALRLHSSFGAVGYSRTDLVLRDGVPVVLEINSTPRLRAGSPLGMSAAAADRFGGLLAGLAELALHG